MLTVVPGEGSGHEAGKDGSPSLIDEIVREGARRMLAEALQAEVDAYIAAHSAEREGRHHRTRRTDTPLRTTRLECLACWAVPHRGGRLDR
jgi:hypothetical protein